MGCDIEIDGTRVGHGGPRWPGIKWRRTTALRDSYRQSIHKKGIPVTYVITKYDIPDTLLMSTS